MKTLPPDFYARPVLEVARDFVQLVEDVRGALEQFLPAWRDLHAAPVARQQRDAQDVLQFRRVVGQGLAEAPVPGDGTGQLVAVGVQSGRQLGRRRQQVDP